MNRFARNALHALCALLSFALAHGGAAAQSYPTKPIRLIVPFAAGGGSDVVGRVVAQKLGERLGQQVLVENRPGAGGSIGADQVAKAAPDGYTLLLGSTSEIAQYPNLNPKVPYDPVRDFAPIGAIGTVPLVLVASETLPAKSVAEVIAFAKANPGKISFGSAGNGSTTHLAMELFASIAGISMTHVPYKGSAPVVTDLLNGNLQLAIPTMPAVLPHASGGKLKLLAVSTARRTASLPAVPTMQDAGVRGYDTGLWTGLLAPAGTPREVVAKLATELQWVVSQPDVKDQLAKQGAEAAPGSAEAFAAQIREELGVWARVVKQANIRLD